MSLKPRPIQPIPEETVRVALAAFPKGNAYLTLRDEVDRYSRMKISLISIRRRDNRRYRLGD